MRRHDARPREGWLEIVEGQGLTYAVDRAEDGGARPYWHEAAAYELSEEEVEYLEGVTEELHAMSLEAARRMLDDQEIMARLGLPRAAAGLVRAGLSEPDPLTLYGRFDLAYGERSLGPAKLLEYNADTPAGLVEAAVTQWYWLEDVAPDRDQWNMLHERLVQAWKRAAPRIPGSVVHFAVGAREPNEDWATVAYLRDTAREAGLIDLGITMEEIGWHHERETFVDTAGLPIRTCFKMYPWEWMLREDFGRHVLDGSLTTWIEPIWKVLLGSKALLPVLWEMFPGHENLLPAYFDGPGRMDSYVAKPMFGWEGSGIRVVRDGAEVEARPERHATAQEYVFQRFVDLPDFDGSHPVVGTWIVGGHAAGLGIRESDRLVTDTDARFVPHYMDAPRSTPEQVARWLAEDGGEPRNTNGGEP
ncbi:glutathionylspermidine synthase family protein [Rubrobacter marinus]|uniref:Glutathionylspermidine synthase family protein n=1 Tax=Rubrobacter marinus TaxID=2653852 RepID=A0A6G8Q208_9ACTN|nr:glutathionylspermidine synthase family protein [Rubrobacter marinus]QIN80357.1 glutathionylspermidine synthase family protein [Rubrobacter marinus]